MSDHRDNIVTVIKHSDGLIQAMLNNRNEVIKEHKSLSKKFYCSEIVETYNSISFRVFNNVGNTLALYMSAK